MGFVLMKKKSLLFLLFSAAIFSTSFAVRLSKSLDSPELKEIATTNNDFESRENDDLELWKQQRHDDEIQERVLRVETNDYGRYDPAPALVKPRFKLIPN
ncbi:uncharacterized protein LOC105172980 [Sesamum indicum]|uniref:Uncharacterized protein LOC105172980 n=1 Tax=Sesamum indicum TaxID=4182 RepID=A0A6I9U6R8_SESIN|nr:uncharacterized protein LOC105172980 [Sesamum indicum]